MEKLHKIADWMLRNKELVVLVLLLATLLFRGYSLLNPKEAPPVTMGQMAKMPNEEPVEPPPPPPPPPEPILVDGLVRANPFTTRTPPKPRVGDRPQDERPPLEIRSIQKFRDGSFKAQIATKAGVRAKWYRESEQFESYRVERINAEDESVTVYSEEHRKNFVYKVESAR